MRTLGSVCSKTMPALYTTTGRALSWMFDPIATITVNRSTVDKVHDMNGTTTDPDEAAIEVGALDVASVSDSYHFICESSEISTVAQALSVCAKLPHTRRSHVNADHLSLRYYVLAVLTRSLLCGRFHRQSIGWKWESAETGYSCNTPVQVEAGDEAMATALIQALQESEFVEGVYTNLDISEDTDPDST